jgi:hypothetical protein
VMMEVSSGGRYSILLARGTESSAAYLNMQRDPSPLPWSASHQDQLISIIDILDECG